MLVIGPENVDLSKVKPGDDMVEAELLECINAHQVMVPSTVRDQINLVNALLLADGLLQPGDLTRSDAQEWSKRTVADLKQECSKRGLSTKGLKSQLINKLVEWESRNTESPPDEHQNWHVDANIGVVPTVVSTSDLAAAHQLQLALRTMTVSGQVCLGLPAASCCCAGCFAVLAATCGRAATSAPRPCTGAGSQPCCLPACLPSCPPARLPDAALLLPPGRSWRR